MLTGIEILGGALVGLGSLGAYEALVHRRRLRSIPIRIHVSGTRGKSSVTRLIAAASREAGRVTVAKTTGTLARLILPDEREVPMFRPAGPNILEQTRVVEVASSVGAEILVVECMALLPELHWLSERRLVQATHAVITNARADHLDVMGPTEREVALCLAGMIPVKGVLYTAERRNLALLEEASRDRATRLVPVTEAEIRGVTPEMLAGFRHTEHPANVAVALRVTSELGIDPATALRGMHRAKPDPGAQTDRTLDFFGRRLYFINGFAANDPESTAELWRAACERHPDADRRIAIFNLRADRPTRTLQLARHTDFWHTANRVILMGTGAYHFARAAARLGRDPSRFSYAEALDTAEIFERVVELCGPTNLVVGMGNIGGQGLELARYFNNRAVLEGAA
jgi:poly-gamma-glutamate synthase PgsB/CapB